MGEKKMGKLGKPESSEMRNFVRDVEERMEWYKNQMQDVYESSNRWWRLYLNKRADPRARDEDWRANIFVPKPFTNVEAMTAAAVSTLTSADPIWQPEAVHDQDIERARSVEKLLDYTARKNSYTKFLTKLSREKYVTGTSFFKTTWVEEAHEVDITPRPGAIEGLLSAIEDAKRAGAVDPPAWEQYPEEFMQWRELVNKSGKAKIPEPPYGGPTTVVRYRGPKFTRLPLYDVFLDPLVDEIADQNFIVHRIVKPRAWVEERAEKGFYNKAAVAVSLNEWDGKRLSEWESQLAQDRGILSSADSTSDPQYRDSCELLEVWQPDSEVPFAIIMNRKAVINKNPYTMPFEHGMCAISAVRHIVIPGQFFGQSALQAPESLFDELNKLRNLRSDGATLNVLPIFTKLKEVGLPDALRRIRPGSIIPMSRPDGIQSLVKAPMPPEAYREPEEINREIDDAMQVYDSTRGAPATVGRVTGTEFQGRSAQAGLRGKLDIQFQEEDMLPSLHQAISLWAQMSDEPIRVEVTGDPSPFKDLSKADIVESLDMQFRFRGVTRALNKDMQIQQLTMLGEKFGANLLPQEIRLLMRLILEEADLRGSSRIISQEGTMQKTQDYEMQRNMSLMQIDMQTKQMQAAASMPPGGQPVPQQGEAPGAPAQAAPPQEGGSNEQAPPA